VKAYIVFYDIAATALAIKIPSDHVRRVLLQKYIEQLFETTFQEMKQRNGFSSIAI